jgi:hypothetical protein
MVKINQRSLTMGLSAILVAAAIGSSSFGAVYADNNNDNDNNDNSDNDNDNDDNDKVKVDCNDVAMALATLWLAVGDLDEDGRDTLDDELQEGEISQNVEDIADNFQNVRDKVGDKCDNLDFGINFVDFEDNWPN